MSGTVSVDAAGIDRYGPNGAVWSLPHDGDLDANLVVLAAGDAVASHVNDEVDVLVVVLDGTGATTIDGVSHALAASVVVHIPKGVTREIRAGDTSLLYLSVHRTRSGLRIGRRSDRSAPVRPEG